ncbi:MAG: gliding motility-associated peptidyl-prolyl isomerase GldI [Bacteroidetes bacterium MedPE-SWsnd-G2]|nr:MAG: gliding motility-associated peptidyl-prolyl isomerase GldI [Bacteroidetes bacterium MedPE-SWsnd-G2]
MKTLLLTFGMCLALCACKSPEARKPISKSSGSFISESVERNKAMFNAQKLRIEEMNAAQTDVEYIASKSGFWYYYNSKIEKDTIMPSFGDVVNFNYNVSDFSGNEIYSTSELGTQNYIMDKEELFTGLREGLKLMKPTETVTFLFPSQKAYGYYGDENKIGTNVPLICKVTVNTITQTQND